MKALPKDYEKVLAFYYALIDSFKNTEYSPGWKKDIYPAPDDLRKEISSGSLFCGMEQGSIVSAMVLNHVFQDDVYAEAKWNVNAADDEVLVIHLLGVRTDLSRKGLGREMVRFAIDLAEKTGMKAIRLDVIKGNLPAERLYLSLGFSYINEVPMYYPDVGWIEFKLYELAIK